MSAIPSARKSRGRPRVDATPINVRLPPEQVTRLDTWREAQPDKPSRPEAIRRLVEAGLLAEKVRTQSELWRV